MSLSEILSAMNRLMLFLPWFRFVVSLSTLGEDVGQGQKTVNEAMNALFSIPISGKPEENSTDSHSENTVLRLKPSLLWSTVYIQELTMVGILFLCYSLRFSLC